MSSKDEEMQIKDLGDEVLEQLDGIILDQLRLTILRVMEEIAGPADLNEAQQRSLTRATTYGTLAHLILLIGRIEGPDKTISTVVDIMVDVLEDNFPGIKIDKHIVAQTNTTKH